MQSEDVEVVGGDTATCNDIPLPILDPARTSLKLAGVVVIASEISYGDESGGCRGDDVHVIKVKAASLGDRKLDRPDSSGMDDGTPDATDGYWIDVDHGFKIRLMGRDVAGSTSVENKGKVVNVAGDRSRAGDCMDLERCRVDSSGIRVPIKGCLRV
jgi:hypothetical protein